MNTVWYRFVVVTSLAVLAVSSAACGSRDDSESSSPAILGPSSAGQTDAKGGGKPGGGGSSSLRLVLSTDVGGDGQVNWGDTVTFEVSTTATTAPDVELICRQNGQVVYGATAGFYPSYPWPWARYMTLSSTSWKSGAADCTAQLYYGSRRTVLATLNFIAGA